jgi:hypothetical protein
MNCHNGCRELALQRAWVTRGGWRNGADRLRIGDLTERGRASLDGCRLCVSSDHRSRLAKRGSSLLAPAEERLPDANPHQASKHSVGSSEPLRNLRTAREIFYRHLELPCSELDHAAPLQTDTEERIRAQGSKQFLVAFKQAPCQATVTERYLKVGEGTPCTATPNQAVIS